MGGFFLFVIPGFIFMITYIFVLPVVVLEDVKVSPLKMSVALTKDNKWQLLAMFLLVYIAVCGPAFAIALIGRLLEADGNANIIYLVVSYIPGLLLGQLFSGVMVVSYEKLKKLKIKKEKNNPDNFRGLGMTAGCAAAVLIMAAIIAAAAAGIMLSESVFKDKAAIQSSGVTEAE